MHLHPTPCQYCQGKACYRWCENRHHQWYLFKVCTVCGKRRQVEDSGTVPKPDIAVRQQLLFDD